MSGLIALELKTLEEDGSERMGNLLRELQQRPDWPTFYGSAPFQSMVKHLDDPSATKLQFVNRAGRAIVTHIKKANKQLRAHAHNFPRKNSVRVMLLINEDHELYDPSLVAYIAQHALHRKEGGDYLYPHIDFVLFASERHASVMHGKLTFPLISVEGPSLDTAVWKRSVMEQVFYRWGRWNDNPVFDGDPANAKFSTIEDIPREMPRHELWRLNYRRNPYLRHLSTADLRDQFDEVQAAIMLRMLKNAPVKLTTESAQKAIELFTHVHVEMNDRGISAEEFSLNPGRLAAAATRIGMPSIVAKWFRSMDKI